MPGQQITNNKNSKNPSTNGIKIAYEDLSDSYASKVMVYDLISHMTRDLVVHDSSFNTKPYLSSNSIIWHRKEYGGRPPIDVWYSLLP